MGNWFECGVSYEKMLENGMQKKVTELYLLDALSFTEVEVRIVEEMRPYINGEFSIASIKRAKLSELFLNNSGDRYFKAKIQFVTLDEKSGREKRNSAYMLIQASDIQEAKDNLQKGMEGTMADWELPEIKETKIIDVFKFN